MAAAGAARSAGAVAATACTHDCCAQRRRARRVPPRAALVGAASPLPRGILPYTTARECGDARMAVEVTAAEDGTGDAVLDFTVEAPFREGGGPLVLHWAVTLGDDPEWISPPEPGLYVPQETTSFGDGVTWRTEFVEGKIQLRVPAVMLPGYSAERPVTSVRAILVRMGGHPDDEEEWMHANDGEPIRAPLMDAATMALPAGPRLMSKLAQAERTGGMNNYKRYCMAVEAMLAPEFPEAPEGDASAAAVLYAHIKLAESRALPLYAGHNYHGKDMVHQSENLCTWTALRASREDTTDASRLARCMLTQLPRGGGGGDDIRMGILNVMRDNGIKEGHRKGIECPFLAQWHQKLHSSTTKDDIAICEAYLHFLQGSGDWEGDFYGHLNYHAGLTKADLEEMKVGYKNETGIIGPATHLPHLIPAFEWFLKVLKTTHSGAEMEEAFAHAKYTMDEQLQWDMEDMLQHRDADWIPAKILDLRTRLQPSWLGVEDRFHVRDALMLDVALEEHFRRRLEAMDVYDTFPHEAADLLRICLQCGELASSGPLLCQASRMWARVVESATKGCWGKAEWLTIAVAGLETVKLALEVEMDALAVAVQTPAEIIGRAGGAAESYLANFGEECVRGHPLFVCARVIQRLETAAREGAGLGPWACVSKGDSNGIAEGAMLTAPLATLQGAAGAIQVANATGDAGAVLLSERIDGLEDVPLGITAVLTRSNVDMLSHVALRARQAGALLACCTDDEAWNALMACAVEGAKVRVAVDSSGGHLSLDAATGGATAAARGANSSAKPRTHASNGVSAAEAAAAGVSSSAWVLDPASYVPGVVGGKSSNLARLGELASEVGAATGVDVRVPTSVALPFNAFDNTVILPENTDARVALEKAMVDLNAAGSVREATHAALAAARAAVERLAIPPGLVDEVRQTALKVGAEGIAEACDDAVEPAWWQQVRRVWASKYNERAYASRTTLGMKESDVRMAVLLMEIVPSEYAFVLHSRNPVAEKPAAGEMMGEVVVGLGETLVDNYPGAPLRFAAKAATETNAASRVKVLALPSKLEAIHAAQDNEAPRPLICRSDSSGEDLEGFSGAGLYDSFTTAGAVARSMVEYSTEPLLWEEDFRSDMCDKLAKVATAVEAAMGGPQDIEGAIVDDILYLLQTRPQQL